MAIHKIVYDINDWWAVRLVNRYGGLTIKLVSGKEHETEHTAVTLDDHDARKLLEILKEIYES